MTDVVTDTFLVEFFNDTTDDAGDYWQMCIDGDKSEGAAPASGDFRIDSALSLQHLTRKLYH